MQCALLLADPRRARRAGEAVAEELRRKGIEADSVLSPALGGVIIGHEVASALGVPFRFVEREGAGLALRRGFAIESGERVVVVEDVVTTGKSTLETAAIAEAAGATVTAIGSIIDRSRRPSRLPCAVCRAAVARSADLEAGGLSALRRRVDRGQAGQPAAAEVLTGSARRVAAQPEMTDLRPRPLRWIVSMLALSAAMRSAAAAPLTAIVQTLSAPS